MVDSSPIPEEIMQGNRKEVEQRLNEGARLTVDDPPKADHSEEIATTPLIPKAPPKYQAGKISIAEDLIMFGALRHEVTVGNKVFVVSTLNNGQKEEAFGAIAHIQPNTFLHFALLRDHIMANAIVSVNGLPLQAFYEADPEDESKKLTKYEQRVRVIKQLHTPLLNKLYELQTILEDKADKAVSEITFDDLKNS